MRLVCTCMRYVMKSCCLSEEFLARARDRDGGMCLSGLPTAELRANVGVAALISDVPYDRLCSQARRVGRGIESGGRCLV